MINSNDPKALKKLLETKKYNENISTTSEYRDQFNAERLYEITKSNESYVSKRANAESEFWKSGKSALEDPKIKEEIIYKSTTRQNFTETTVVVDKEHNMRKTRISEYSNALFNGTIFINPTHLSC